jgi:hypothetical protein
MGAFVPPLADGILDPPHAMSYVGTILQVKASKSVETIRGYTS